jgi:hypothetical protein
MASTTTLGNRDARRLVVCRIGIVAVADDLDVIGGKAIISARRPVLVHEADVLAAIVGRRVAVADAERGLPAGVRAAEPPIDVGVAVVVVGVAQHAIGGLDRNQHVRLGPLDVDQRIELRGRLARRRQQAHQGRPEHQSSHHGCHGFSA